MTATFTAPDATVHTYSSYTVTGEFDCGHVGPARSLAACTCGWRGTPVTAGHDTAQWNAHVASKESSQ